MREVGKRNENEREEEEGLGLGLLRRPRVRNRKDLREVRNDVLVEV